MGRKTEKIFFQKRHTNSPLKINNKNKKMLLTTNNQENENQNYNEISSHAI